MVKCLNCGTEFIFKTGKKFCTERCNSAYNSRKRYNDPLKRQKIYDYHKQYAKSLSPEKKKQYSKNGLEKRRLHEKLIKEKYPEKYRKRLDKSNSIIKGYRERILNHYNNQCVICGFKEVLDIHHLEQKTQKYDLHGDLNKYIVLCPNHHTMFHRGKMTKEELLRHIERYKQ